MSPDFKCSCGCGQTVHRTPSKAREYENHFVNHDHELKYRAEHPESRKVHRGIQDWRKILLKKDVPA